MHSWLKLGSPDLSLYDVAAPWIFCQALASRKVPYLEIEVKKLEEVWRRQNKEKSILSRNLSSRNEKMCFFFFFSSDGMQALYKVDSCSMDSSVEQLTGKVRQYFIEAHEIQWDYGPRGRDGRTGKSLREPGR